MRSFWTDPYLWIHLAGLAALPIFLELCLLGLAMGDPVLPVSLEFLLVAIAGVAPILWMQWQHPFCIFSLLGVALKPQQLTEAQRKLLTLFQGSSIRGLSILSAIFLTVVLWQLYRLAPIAAASVVPTQSRFVGILLAAIAFLLSNLFLQVPVSVLRVLFASEAEFSAATPYPIEKIAKDFTLLGLRVNRLLPPLVTAPSEMAPATPASATTPAPVSVAPVPTPVVESPAAVPPLGEPSPEEPPAIEPPTTEPDPVERETASQADETPQTTSPLAVDEGVGEAIGDITHETIGESTREVASETIGDITRETIGESASEVASEVASETIGESASEVANEVASEVASETIGEGESVSEVVSESDEGDEGVDERTIAPTEPQMAPEVESVSVEPQPELQDAEQHDDLPSEAEER